MIALTFKIVDVMLLLEIKCVGSDPFITIFLPDKEAEDCCSNWEASAIETKKAKITLIIF